MRRAIVLGLVLTLMVIGGCVPTLYQWSFDGRWMTVQSKGVLHFTDADGTLLRTQIPDVSIATWFPDSDRVLVSKDHQEKTWDAVFRYLTADQIKSISQAGQRMNDFALSYTWKDSEQNWQAFSDALTKEEESTGRDIHIYKEWDIAVAIYAREHASDAVKKKIPTARWKDLEDLTQTVHSVESYGANAFGAIEGKTIMKTAAPVVELRVSPRGDVGLIVTKVSDSGLFQLWIAPSNGTKPAREISDRAAWNPDWTPDGRDVVFASATGTKSQEVPQSGIITRTNVVGEDGKILSEFGPPNDEAYILFSPLTRIRCLKDGRIIFATTEMSFPAPANNAEQRFTLFSINPSAKSTGPTPFISKESAEKAGDFAEFFEINADATRISIPDQTGKVSVVDLASGQVTWVQDKPVNSAGHNGILVTVPTWRGSDELTMIAPDDEGQPMVVGYSMSGHQARHLSKDWRAGIIEEPDRAVVTTQETQSATRQ